MEGDDWQNDQVLLVDLQIDNLSSWDGSTQCVGVKLKQNAKQTGEKQRGTGTSHKENSFIREWGKGFH